ncbi:MAG: hypothetical protein ACLUD0_05700 [Eubacterium ramulus]
MKLAKALDGSSKVKETGITATARMGIESCIRLRLPLDIIAKPPRKAMRCIGTLTESSYRKMLWSRKPLSDFWRIGRKTERKLAQYGMYTMGDIAKMSSEFGRLAVSVIWD